MIIRSEEEMRKVREVAEKTALPGMSKFRGDTYESGVINTIDWLLGEGSAPEEINPMDE